MVTNLEPNRKAISKQSRSPWVCLEKKHDSKTCGLVRVWSNVVEHLECGESLAMEEINRKYLAVDNYMANLIAEYWAGKANTTAEYQKLLNSQRKRYLRGSALSCCLCLDLRN